jgi:hypothetical protein
MHGAAASKGINLLLILSGANTAAGLLLKASSRFVSQGKQGKGVPLLVSASPQPR